MPELALLLIALWALLLFVARSIVQWKRTGSTGFNGIRGRVGSLEWFAGVSVGSGLGLILIAPMISILQWRSGELLFDKAPIHQVGALFVVVGIVGSLAAQMAMGDSWRIGVDKNERTSLVTQGIYQWVRNPIFSFMGMSTFGYLLVIPNVWTVLAMVLVLIGVQLQVRFVEEPYLLAMHGEQYERYTASVGRFLPALGRSRNQTPNCRRVE